MSDKDTTPPPKLDRAEVTVEEVRETLAHSAKAMVRLIQRSLETGGHVYNQRPDVVALVCAAITHEALQCGQICHWARELGAPIAPEQRLKLWEWDKRCREVAGGGSNA